MAYTGKTLDSFSLWRPGATHRSLFRLVYIRCTAKLCRQPWHGPYLYERRGKREFYIGRIESDRAQKILHLLLSEQAAIENCCQQRRAA